MLWCCVATIGTAKIGMPLLGVKIRPITQGEVKKRGDNGTSNNETLQTSYISRFKFKRLEKFKKGWE